MFVKFCELTNNNRANLGRGQIQDLLSERMLTGWSYKHATVEGWSTTMGVWAMLGVMIF